MITFEERPTSGSGNAIEPTEEREYVCSGLEDVPSVMMMAMQLTPPAVAGRQGILQRQDIRVACQGYQLYYVTVPYAPKKKQAGEWTWDYDTGGGTFNMKASRETIAKYVQVPWAVRDFKGAIGVQGGTVEGINVVIPSLRLNAQYRHPLGVITLQFVYGLADITGCVNSKPMFGRAPGEVLFLGGRGSDGTEAEATAGYSFAIEKNLQNKLIGGINVVKKDGHDAAWITFEESIDAGQPVRIPVQINIERIYERVDLASLLGFGG